ncbi:hypothetical protein LCGC14_2079980 [marine sediment metagenome]|uniref:Uncharacterized protein n=1 Tax=marine sediment metagenome TaxID=412755 RepID=A0A0F9GUA0_9ZZZZ
MEVSKEDLQTLENLNDLHDVYQREIMMGKLFLKYQGRKPHTPNEVADWYIGIVMGYDAEYMKIEGHHLEHCFCSLADCKEGDFLLDQIVVTTGGDLFHPKCYGPFKIRKPDYEDTPLHCSICDELYARISYETYMKVWKRAKCPACLQKAVWDNHKNANS